MALLRAVGLPLPTLAQPDKLEKLVALAGKADTVRPEIARAKAFLGELDPAFQHCKRALALNPRHRGAHEYAGEAYLLVGDLASAEEHLAALGRVRLLPCEELADLEREITACRQRTGAGRSTLSAPVPLAPFPTYRPGFALSNSALYFS